METTKGKYDTLITVLLPLHSRMLQADKKEILIGCVNELRSQIGRFNQETDIHLSVLSKMLLTSSDEYGMRYKYILEESRNEALSILTKFFFELEPEEYGLHYTAN